MGQSFQVRLADWVRDETALRSVREAVFVHEQAVPLSLEWDGIDPQCLHVLAENENGRAIGTGRLLPDGHIGRMAVLAEWRGRGVGSALLGMLIACARERGMREVIVNAQTHAIAFYRGHGFVEEGAIFLDAGIPHRCMRRSCARFDHKVTEAAG